MSGAPRAQRLLAGSLAVPVVLVLQAATPSQEVGIEELAGYAPIVIRVGWFLGGFLAVVLVGRVLVQPAMARLIRRRNRNNPTLENALVLYFQVFVVLVAVLFGAGVAGYGPFLGDSALLLSAVALAIGVAAQEVIGSIVSGIALVLDPEFNVGDYIEWQDGEGVVQSIALRVTRVETQDGKLVTIPNTILTSHEIVRPYGRGNHRIVHELGIAYEDDVAAATKHLEDVAASMEEILAEPPPAAYVHELGDDDIAVRVHYWIEDPDRRDILAVRSAYASAVKSRLERAGITISPASQRALRGRIGIDGSIPESDQRNPFQ